MCRNHNDLLEMAVIESRSLRHEVCTAEKVRSLRAEIREQCPYFAIIPRQIGLRRTDCSASNTDRSPALSATKSALQRKSARSAPKYANNARISRLFLDKSDCGERTARHRIRSLS